MTDQEIFEQIKDFKTYKIWSIVRKCYISKRYTRKGDILNNYPNCLGKKTHVLVCSSAAGLSFEIL